MVQPKRILGWRQAFRVLAYGVGDVWPALDGHVQGPAPDPDYALMPVFLAHADKRAMFQHVATENAARKDLSAVEEALLLRQALDEFGMSVEEAGAIFGWARSTAANKLRLLQLPVGVQTMVRRGTVSERAVSERAARELIELAQAEGIKLPLPAGWIAKLELHGFVVDLVTGEFGHVLPDSRGNAPTAEAWALRERGEVPRGEWGK